MPYEIPNHWVYLRLGEIGDFKKGPFGSALTKSTFVKDSDDSIKVYEQKNAIQKSENLGEYFITNKYYEQKMVGFTVHGGDVIISCAGTIGETFILPDNCRIGIINQALMRVRLFSQISKDFFKYLFEYILNSKGDKKGKGSAIKNIPPFEVLLNFVVGIPPIEEQKRIVAKLEELLPLIDELETDELRLQELMQQFPMIMSQSILLQAFEGKLTTQLLGDGYTKNELKDQVDIDNSKRLSSDYDFNYPENWELLEIGEVCRVSTGNSINETEKISKYSKKTQGYSYIGTKDVKFDHSIDYENGIYIPYNSNFRIAKAGSTLLCIEGGSAGRKIGLLERDVCYGNKLASFYPLYVEPKFLFFYMKSPVFQSQFKENMNGMIGGVGINKIKKALIPAPPLVEQKRIVDKLNKLLPIVEKLNAE